MAGLSYITQFWLCIIGMYRHLLMSNELYNISQDIQIINTKDIRLPKTTVSGYRDHNHKTLLFNTDSYDNGSETKTLGHDCDIGLATNPMDVDETDQIVSLANIQSCFGKTQAIPGLDCYTFSKFYTEAKRIGAKISNTAITTANILSDFDINIEAMEEIGVPLERVTMYYAPVFRIKLKNAKGVQRTLEVSGDAKNTDRRARSLDDISTTRTTPASRLKITFDFTEGFQVVGVGKQTNYIVTNPKVQVSHAKYSYIEVFTLGHDNRIANKYLYQSRRLSGTFALLDDLPKQGCIINTGVKGWA